jgi:two-component system, OmpR family, sensor histidine kinase MtrB
VTVVRAPGRLPWGAVTAPFRGLATSWRRSLQARVVLSTVVLSALVVVLLGMTLLRQISDGLVDGRVRVALDEAARSTGEVQTELSAATGDLDVDTKLPALLARVVSRGQGQGFGIVLVGPLPSSGGLDREGQRFTPGLDPASIPTGLRERVEARSDPTSSWTFTSLRDAAGGNTPAVAVGSLVRVPADGSTFALYHLFPMTEEESTLALVRRALLTSGLLLLVLVPGVAWLVTRQVVTPVRMARRVAERIASGRLEERMQVRGEDDIARLAGSFNQMATSLQRQIRALEEMSAGQRRFVSDVSHELRTPLTTVRMAADVLHDNRDRFDAATARAAELLHAELDRFESLLTGLLEISRYDAGAAVLHLDRVDLVDVARRAIDQMSVLASRTDVSITLRAPSRPVMVEADLLRVERIVRNLMSNALDFAGRAPRSEVVVQVGGSEGAGALTVRDYGAGLQPGDERRVFHRFWRADPSRVRSTGGTGLGLAIASEDARLHGGRLEAWGAPGAGAQFRLLLPRAAGTQVREEPLPLEPVDAHQAEALR